MAWTSAIKKSLMLVMIPVLAFIAMTANYWTENANHLFSTEKMVLNTTGAKETREPNMLIIESLGIKAPIIHIDKTGEPIFQKALERGVVRYPGTARVGELGNTYIFGHSSDYVWKKGNYKAVFARLPSIKIGAKILASDQNGNVFVYTVVRKFVAAKTDTNLLHQNGRNKKQLTLQTSYPVGTALKRFIVIAEI